MNNPKTSLEKYHFWIDKQRTFIIPQRPLQENSVT